MKPLPLAAALAALLSACTQGPDFKAPDAPTLPGYTEGKAPDLGPQRLLLGERLTGKWWSLFHDPALDSVVETALAGNKTLARAKATLAQARQAAVAAAGAEYPQVNFGANATRQQINPKAFGIPFAKNLTAPPFNVYTIGPNVSYALDIFGGIKRQAEEQQALADAAGYEVSAAALTLSGNVVMQAMTIASARAQLAALEEILANDERNLSLVETSRQAGTGTEVEVLSARSQLLNDRTLLPPLRQQESIARDAMAILVGQAPAAWSPPVFELAAMTLPADLPVSLPSELVRRRPDIQAAEAQLHAASAAIGVATANLYPQLTLTANYAEQAVTPSTLFNQASNIWNVTGGLTAPLFHGGALEAQRAAAKAAYEASLAAYEQTVLQAFGQVADLLHGLDHDNGLVAAQKASLDIAQASLRLARISFQAGNAGILQVLDAERLYQQGRLGLVRSEIQRYEDTAQLFLALGGAPPD